MRTLLIAAGVIIIGMATRAEGQSDNPVADSYERSGCAECAVLARQGRFDEAAQRLKDMAAAKERAAHEPSAVDAAVDKLLYPQGKESAACDDRVSYAREVAASYLTQLERLKERIHEQYPDFDVDAP